MKLEKPFPFTKMSYTCKIQRMVENNKQEEIPVMDEPRLKRYHGYEKTFVHTTKYLKANENKTFIHKV